MGNSEPIGRKPRSIEEALKEAEEDHYLDCPNADFPTRAAALILDCILVSIVFSGIHQTFLALDGYLLNASLVESNFDTYLVLTRRGLAAFSWVLKISAGYFYFIWCTFQFGGSPGKLITGIRVLQKKNGKKLNPSQAFFREALVKPLSIISLVGVLLPLMRKDNRTLHDIATATVAKKVHN